MLEDFEEKIRAILKCSICWELLNLDDKNGPVNLKCGHTLCQTCTKKETTSLGEISCPISR